MRCEQCQKVIPDDCAFCAYCGAKAAASGMHAPVFRFANSADQAVTLRDLAYLIDHNWEASLDHLYAGDFANWLGSLGRGVLADQARKIVKSYPDDRPLGLELFVNLLSDASSANIPPASPALAPPRVDFGSVPRDSLVQERLVITNKHGRGHLSGRLRLPPGVFWLNFTPREFSGPRTEVTLTVNTRDMPAGAHLRTRLMVTTPFETVETEVRLRISAGWVLLLRALALWALGGAVAAGVGVGAALAMRDLLPAVPWPLVYAVMAFLVALVAFGSIKTRDAAAAIVLSALVGLVAVVPIALGVLALTYVLALLDYQTATLAAALDSTAGAFAVMAGVGGLLGVAAGVIASLRRVGRAQAGLLTAAALLAAMGAVVYTLRPTFAFGEFRSSQPLVDELAVPVPYLAFSATLPPPAWMVAGPAPTPTPTRTPTPEPSPTPAIRPVANVTLLWDVSIVEVEVGVGALAAQVDAEGRAHLAYTVQEGGAALLRHAVRVGEGWSLSTVDTGEIDEVALALDGEGRAYIAYTKRSVSAAGDASSPQVGTLYLAEAQDDDSWAVDAVAGPAVARRPAIVIDAEGRPLVAYWDASALMVSRRGNGAWEPQVVEQARAAGYCPALALDAGGLPHVAYIAAEGGALRYSRFNGTDWFAVAVPYERRAGCDVALSLGAGEERHLLFYDPDAERVVEGSFDGQSWHYTRVGAARALPDGRAPLSLALGADGRAQLTYNAPNSLRFVRDDGQQWQNAVVDGPSTASQVVVDAEGSTHIAYAHMGAVWYATLEEGVLGVLPRTPTPGPSPTPTEPVYVCGDGICQDPERDCELDCRGDGWVCGDGVCDEAFEDPLNCPADCAAPE